MSQHHSRLRRPRSRVRRPEEAGWVLAASLILATMATAVTITYARHALLAKQSLQYGKGASEVDEASRSELERVRELMRIGDKPGTLQTGDHDEAITPTGELVRGEREVTGHGRRELRVEAEGNTSNSNEEARLRADSQVVPGSHPTGEHTTLECDTGEPIMLTGSVTIIDGAVAYQGVQMAGIYLLEEGAELTLEDVVLHGTILTRHGACPDNLPAVGANRPAVRVYGGLRLLAGTELPGVAICAPDLVLETDASSRVEVDGFVSADEVLVNGRGTVRGLVVHNAAEQFSSKTRRPGYGRGAQEYPDTVVPGSEEVASLSFPVASVDEATIIAMESYEIN